MGTSLLQVGTSLLPLAAAGGYGGYSGYATALNFLPSLCTPPSLIICPRFHSPSQLHLAAPQTLRILPTAGAQCPRPEPARLGEMERVGAGVRGLGVARTLEREERKTTHNDELGWHCFLSATFSLSYQGQRWKGSCSFGSEPARCTRNLNSFPSSTSTRTSIGAHTVLALGR